MVSLAEQRPVRPWRPARFRVHGIYSRTVTPKRGPNAGRRVKLYDVRFTVDGWGFSRTIERKGFASGHLFDPSARVRRADECGGAADVLRVRGGVVRAAVAGVVAVAAQRLPARAGACVRACC